MVDQMHGLLSQYLKKLDNDIVKFKTDLEVNNSGITDLIEKSKHLKLNLFLMLGAISLSLKGTLMTTIFFM